MVMSTVTDLGCVTEMAKKVVLGCVIPPLTKGGNLGQTLLAISVLLLVGFKIG